MMNEKQIKMEIHPDGTKIFHRDSRLHREDGPAVICPDGWSTWWIDGHRHDGYGLGYREYFREGYLHRLDGPAVERNNGEREYWINGQRVEPFEVKP
jgi:hypothetical protein